ncbi:toxin-antitoxin system YwqK family antitoxin [Ekhidna sp. To15]|uniref:toxin-antitoxin system YwqK family antitoxin n=1 Tax=Ekhidna sp. To15 TaxID=3395267 RepID=UPI003F51F65F
MNKTQVLIALVILSLFGVISTYLDVSSLLLEEDEPAVERKVRDGEVRQFTKDQRLKTVVNYDKGIKHGTSYLYHNDGKTVLLAMPYVQGKRQGVSKKYYENGKLYASTSYQNDLLHGPRTLYYSSGQIKAVINYGNGNPGLATTEYLLDGTQKSENEIVADKRGRIIHLSTSEACKDSKFYIGKLIEDQFFNAVHPDVKLLAEEDGEYFVDIDIHTPSYLRYQDIICHCESKQGNPIIMKTRLY